LDRITLVDEKPDLADFDSNGRVDGYDFLIWQRSKGTSSEGDANHDGVTDTDDFILWMSQWGVLGNDAATRGIPEPATWIVWLVGGIVVMGTRGDRGRQSKVEKCAIAIQGPGIFGARSLSEAGV
jgi:hypothetical protein